MIQPVYPPCDHDHLVDNPRRCGNCGTLFCQDCGHVSAWWRSRDGHCRDCAGKHGDPIYVMVDPDRVLEHFNGDTMVTDQLLDQWCVLVGVPLEEESHETD